MTELASTAVRGGPLPPDRQPPIASSLRVLPMGEAGIRRNDIDEPTGSLRTANAQHLSGLNGRQGSSASAAAKSHTPQCNGTRSTRKRKCMPAPIAVAAASDGSSAKAVRCPIFLRGRGSSLP